MSGRLIVVIFALLALGLAWWNFRAPNASASKPSLSMVVASTLAPVMQPLVDEFHKTHPDVAIIWQSGSSSQLSMQIIKGLHTDIFISADPQFVDMLDKQSMITKGSKRVIARAGLCVLIRKGLAGAAGDHAAAMTAMLTAEIKSVAVPNPAFSPFGTSAKGYLESRKVWSNLQAKVVYAENAERTAKMCVGNDIAAAVLPLPLCHRPEVQAKYMILDIPFAESAPVAFTLVAIAGNRSNPNEHRSADEFITFLQSPEAAAILKSAGFIPGE